MARTRPQAGQRHFFKRDLPPAFVPDPGRNVCGAGAGRRAALFRPYPAATAAPVLAYENLGLLQGHGWLFRGLDPFAGERDRLALIGH